MSLACSSRFEGLPHGAAVDLHEAAQFALRGEFIPGAVLFVEDEVSDLAEDLV